jgi:hypothetical protein
MQKLTPCLWFDNQTKEEGYEIPRRPAGTGNERGIST